MTSKEVNDRQKSARAVSSSIEAHAGAAGEVLGAQLRAVLRKGEAVPDLALTLRLFGRLLGRDLEALLEADDRHELERSDDDAPRAARDEAAAVVRDRCVAARDTVATVYGDAALVALGLADVVPHPNDAAGLARYAERAAARLGDKAVALPKPRVPGVVVDRAALAASVSERLAALQGALQDVARERRELETTQAAKNQAMERFDTTFGLAAGVTSAVLRAAGMTDQADRVRPSPRRPGRTDDTPVEPDPTPPTG